MNLPIVDASLIHYTKGRARQATHSIIREELLEIWFNDKLLVKIACAGINLKELAVGYVKSEGLIERIEDIDCLAVEESPLRVLIMAALGRSQNAPILSVMSSGARKGESILPTTPLESPLTIPAKQVLSLMEELLSASEIHETTRGSHCSGLADTGGMICSREDVGRHNTIDMIIGYALLEHIDCTDACILTTGRISSEIVEKVRLQGFPIIISHSAPTSRAIQLADRSGMTLIGYVRNGEMRVYTHEERVTW